ncbi:MAG: AAA family ATPase, partial [Gammaproteobacteria bacterium]|nr:AAA family ATPase [Gammaproteobacteria bacterium]
MSVRNEPERRQIAVMFCDLVGSTQLSERYDPEDLRDLIMTYQNWAANVIKQYKGFVARYLGDGLLVFFGYPEAHENDAERAVLAGLELVDSISALTVQMDREQVSNLQIRIGIATGLVVVGDEIGEDADLQQSTIFGKTPNLAARIQDLATPNTVLVEPRTHHMLRDRFEYEDMGERELKGITHPTRIWRVIKAIDVDTRLEDSWLEQQTPMAGREDEMDIFLRYWQRAQKGNSRAILISGEAGIGKSRVVHELYARISSEPIRDYRFQCSSYHANSAFYPVIRYLEHAAGLEAQDSDSRKLKKLEALVTPLTSAVEMAVPLIAALMSISIKNQYSNLDMSPERQKESTLELLVDLLVSPAQSEPTLVVVEDTHWIDPS